MINSDSRAKIKEMINQINDNGLDLILRLCGNMQEIEIYNINTSKERIEELKQIKKQEEEQRKAQYEKDKAKTSLERAQEECKRQREFKAALTGKEKKFFDLIESVKVNERYSLEYWELMLLVNTYNNNLINGSYDIFRYGFLKGQRAEKNRRKKANKRKASSGAF